MHRLALAELPDWSADDGLVLCVNSRLTRILRARHGELMTARGLTVYPSLNLLTPTQWLDRLTDAWLLHGALEPDAVPAQILGDLEERLLWEAAIAELEAEDYLLDTGDAARLAREAFALQVGWSLNVPDTLATEEYRRYRRWAQGFEARCVAIGALDEARWRQRQARWLQTLPFAAPRRVLLAGFDDITPLLQGLLDTLAGAGATLFRLDDTETESRAGRLEAGDAAEEARFAARWAKARRQRNPSARLAVVVPALDALRPLLVRTFERELHPDAIIAGRHEAIRHYNISLGRPLADTPVVAAALGLLRQLTRSRELDQPALSSLLRSPFWGEADSEATARALFDASLREEGLPVLRLADLPWRARARGCPRLAERLEAALAWLAQEGRGRRLPSAWAEVVLTLLDALGWPGERAVNSAEYQARQSFDEGLEVFARLDRVCGALPWAPALSLLERQMRERVFQTEQVVEAPIQILGPLEAAGQHFDGLWLLGLTDEVWPARAKPNPLLPFRLQAEAGLPRASNAREREYAGRLFRRLIGSAPEVIASHPHHEGERELRPSPLLQALPTLAAETLALAPEPAAPVPAALERITDDRGPALASGERISGGSGVLKAQAANPLWAFARYRLHAKPLAAFVTGPELHHRGTLTHLSLQAFWEKVRTSRALHALTESEREAAIAEAVTTALTQFRGQHPHLFGDTALALERERLANLLRDWLALEARRSPFTVLSHEESHEWRHGALTVRLRLDRLDRLDDGRLLVLDYKTGRTTAESRWGLERLPEPQLPLYALVAAGQGVLAGVALAQVRAEVQRFVGICADDDSLPGVKSLEARGDKAPFGLTEFGAVRARWQDELAGVAAEFCAGQAGNLTYFRGGLAHCEVLPFLRQAEAALSQEDDEGDSA